MMMGRTLTLNVALSLFIGAAAQAPQPPPSPPPPSPPPLTPTDYYVTTIVYAPTYDIVTGGTTVAQRQTTAETTVYTQLSQLISPYPKQESIDCIETNPSGTSPTNKMTCTIYVESNSTSGDSSAQGLLTANVDPSAVKTATHTNAFVDAFSTNVGAIACQISAPAGQGKRDRGQPGR